MELTTLTIILLGERTSKEVSVLQTGEFSINKTQSNIYPAVLLASDLLMVFNTISIWMDLCTDLMRSLSWILTMFGVVSPDLCLQPARTIVPGVSYDISYQF